MHLIALPVVARLRYSLLRVSLIARRRLRPPTPHSPLPSQDPNERKAGLWIWGLFEEPLYPYMLLSFDVNRVEVREGGYHVPAGKLFGEMRCVISHTGPHTIALAW